MFQRQDWDGTRPETVDQYAPFRERTAGIVRIPIDRAMELVLQRGLPVRSGTNRNETGPSSYQLQQQRSQFAQPERK